MPQFFRLQYDDFGGGLSLRYAAHLIQKNEAVVAKNVDIQDRYLQGLKDVGSSVQTLSGGITSPKWLWYSPSATWVTGDYAGETRFALVDGPKVYSTRESKRPVVLTPSETYSLGIAAPNGISYQVVYSAGYQLGTYKYAITFVTANGVESNKQDLDLTLTLDTAGYVNLFDFPISTDTRVVARRIYRSLANSSAMYFLYEIPDNSTVYTSGSPFTDNYPDGRLDLTRPLTWEDGGFPGSGGIYVEDHSVPPALTILSTGLHAANGATGRSGSGVVFGAIGSTVYWSALGFPDYWPMVNQFSLAENVESIVSYGGATFVFTPNFIYQARGDSDDSITWNRTSAAFGVKKGYGRFTTPTAQGILFFAQDGLAVFDGSNARLVAENKLPRGYFDSLTINAVGFFRNRFHVFLSAAVAGLDNAATLIFDFRDGIANPVITSSTHIVTAAHVANYAEPVTADTLPRLPSSVEQIQVTVPGSYRVISSGTSKTVTLTVGAAPTNGTTATATPLFGYERIVVTNGGSGYTSAPSVVIAAPTGGGQTAKAIATIAGGKIVSITITDSGSGYLIGQINNTTTISLVGGGGSSATLDVYAKLTSVNITDSGSAYVGVPSVTVGGTATGSDIAINAQLFASLASELYADAAFVPVHDGSTQSYYRIGGERIKSPNPNAISVTTVDQYSTATENWTRLGGSGVLSSGRQGIAAAGNVNWLLAYIAGGYDRSTGSYSTAVETFNGSAFSNFTAANLPAARAYGSLTALSAGGAMYYVGGLTTSGVLTATIYKWTSGATWASSLSLNISGITYYLAHHAAVLVGDKIYIFGGIISTAAGAVTSGTLNSRVFIIDTANGDAITQETDGPTYGWTGRHSAQVVAYNGKIYIYGGQTSTGTGYLYSVDTALSDLWVYDPSASVGQKWACRTGEVINAYSRARAGYTVDTTNGVMYTLGGTTTYSLYTADGIKIPLAQASDCSGTPGLYVVDSVNTDQVKLFEGGSRMSNWVWKGRREVGPAPGPKLTWTRARMTITDAVKIGATFQDGSPSSGSGESSYSTYATTAVGTTFGSQVRFWFPSVATSPSIPVPVGQWLSLRLEANSSTTAAVYRAEIDAKMDTDGG